MGLALPHFPSKTFLTWLSKTLKCTHAQGYVFMLEAMYACLGFKQGFSFPKHLSTKEFFWLDRRSALNLSSGIVIGEWLNEGSSHQRYKMKCLYTPRNLIGKNFCNFKQSLKHSLGHKLSELKTSSFNVKQYMYINIYIYIYTHTCIFCIKNLSAK